MNLGTFNIHLNIYKKELTFYIFDAMRQTQKHVLRMKCRKNQGSKKSFPIHQWKGISFQHFQRYDSKFHSNLHKCSQYILRAHIWIHFKYVHINISMLHFTPLFRNK